MQQVIQGRGAVLQLLDLPGRLVPKTAVKARYFLLYRDRSVPLFDLSQRLIWKNAHEARSLMKLMRQDRESAPQDTMIRIRASHEPHEAHEAGS